MKSGIYVVATPIGNLNDISSRALEVLQNADVIACEDTRVTKKLFSLLGLGLKKTFVTLHDHNEEEQAQKLIDMVNRGQSIAQVSDAGCPLISDPGYKLIKRCREQGVAVTTIPGPCALICALQLSGLPTNSFMFAGFIPNKDKARKDLFNKLKDIDATLVFYETANRIVKTLETAGEVFFLREMAVARGVCQWQCGGIDRTLFSKRAQRRDGFDDCAADAGRSCGGFGHCRSDSPGVGRKQS